MSLWQRIIELFPFADESPDFAISWEPYRYEATGTTTGYMVWTLIDVVPEFWDKVIPPLLKELEQFRVQSKRNKLSPTTRYIQLPYHAGDIGDFRNWVRTGIWMEDDSDLLSMFVSSSDAWDMDDDYCSEAQEINEEEAYDDDYYEKRKWAKK